ncbi:MAG: hypothetical protein QXT81_00790 [Candidatus Bathyarchaeia archaeon]
MTGEKPVWEEERELKVRAVVDTDPRFGMRPEDRPLQEHLRLGVVNLDKPPNPSSHQVAAWVKRILGASHVGHGGTLEAAEPGRPDGHRGAACST